MGREGAKKKTVLFIFSPARRHQTSKMGSGGGHVACRQNLKGGRDWAWGSLGGSSGSIIWGWQWVNGSGGGGRKKRCYFKVVRSSCARLRLSQLRCSDWSEALGCGCLGMGTTRGVEPVDMRGVGRYGGVVVGA